MLYKYKCKVQPQLHSNTFPYFEQAFSRFRILDKWFYFYINNPTDPVIVWKAAKLNHYQLQPGTNRYIGTALRDSNEWLNGAFVTDDISSIEKVTSEIEILDLFETANLDANDPNFYQITLDNPSHKWGIGNQTFCDDSWYAAVWNWIYENLEYRWGLEYNGTTYYVNAERHPRSSHKQIKTVLDASNFPNIQTAVQQLFITILTTETALNHCI